MFQSPTQPYTTKRLLRRQLAVDRTLLVGSREDPDVGDQVAAKVNIDSADL